MSVADRYAVEAHLDQAVRHLTTAQVLVCHLDSQAELDTRDRVDLNELAASLGVLVHQVTGAIAGEDFERQLADLLADAERNRSE